MPEVVEYGEWMTAPRPVTITLKGRASFRLGEVRRFTAAVNAPATHRDAILPAIEAAEDSAQAASSLACAEYLQRQCYSYTAEDIASIDEDFFVWADREGISYGDAVNANRIAHDALYESRLDGAGGLNALPEVRVQVESASAAGITVSGRVISLTLDPDTVVVFDLLL